MDTQARFWAKVDRSGGADACWIWTGCVANRYGQFGLSCGKRVRAHRYAYNLLVGSIPDGLQIDHLCRNTTCVNPRHLEVVTGRVNTLRGTSFSAQNARKTHCKRGHPLTPDNLKKPKPGRPRERNCRTCAVAQLREYRARKAGAA